MDPNWTITLNQPAPGEGEVGEMVTEGNALRMFESLYENLQSQLKQLKDQIGQLEEKIIFLEKRA